MAEPQETASRPGVAALEYVTGRTRGTMTWLNEPALDISLIDNRRLQVAEARSGEPRENLVGRLHRAGESYEIEAVEGQPLWVNGNRVTAHPLKDCDMVEFGESGPLTRFCLFNDSRPVRTTIEDIMADAVAYLRVSRQPAARRGVRAVSQVFGRLVQQTTLLFRLTVIFAILVLAGLAWQQARLNDLLQHQLERSADRLENFAGALTRAQQEALTPRDLQSLRQEFGGQLTSNAERLAALERRSSASARIVTASQPAVAFLQGAYGFREIASGRMLRQVVDSDGRPMISPLGQPMLTPDGDGPIAERQFTGTGFAIRNVRDADVLVTNRHVALPWETDTANAEALALQGLEPVMVKFIAWLPGIRDARPVTLVRASDDADLALLRLSDALAPGTGLKLAETPPGPGEEVIVMGYPTGLRAILAQSGDAFIETLQQADDTNFWSVAARLSEAGHIAPLASRGIVGQATSATIVYDAETTHGGSGGPVLNAEGAVVAVNAAILPEFGGSNLGVPVAKLRALLAKAGLR